MRKFWVGLKVTIALYIAIWKFDINYKRIKGKGLIIWN